MLCVTSSSGMYQVGSPTGKMLRNDASYLPAKKGAHLMCATTEISPHASSAMYTVMITAGKYLAGCDGRAWIEFDLEPAWEAGALLYPAFHPICLFLRGPKCESFRVHNALIRLCKPRHEQHDLHLRITYQCWIIACTSSAAEASLCLHKSDDTVAAPCCL